MGAQKPNILWICTDQQRYDSLGSSGNRFARTPNLDRLAARGTPFLRAYCQQAVCSPSRSSLMTGLRPDSIKVWDLVTDFRDTVPDVVTLPQAFMT